MLGKYGKDRTSQVPILKKKKGSYSVFVVTINPNRVSVAGTDSYEDTKNRLATLGNFLLEDETITSILKFPNQGEEGGESRKAHLDRIDEILDKAFSLEYGHHQKRLHIHLSIGIKHTTKVLIDRDALVPICQTFFPEGPTVHVNIRGGNGNNGLLEYLRKYPTRRAPPEEIVQED